MKVSSTSSPTPIPTTQCYPESSGDQSTVSIDQSSSISKLLESIFLNNPELQRLISNFDVILGSPGYGMLLYWDSRKQVAVLKRVRASRSLKDCDLLS